MTSPKMNEFDLIQRYFTQTRQRDDVVVGSGDDAAVVRVAPDQDLIISVDTMVEGIHFHPEVEIS